MRESSQQSEGRRAKQKEGNGKASKRRKFKNEKLIEMNCVDLSCCLSLLHLWLVLAFRILNERRSQKSFSFLQPALSFSLDFDLSRRAQAEILSNILTSKSCKRLATKLAGLNYLTFSFHICFMLHRAREAQLVLMHWSSLRILGSRPPVSRACTLWMYLSICVAHSE